MFYFSLYNTFHSDITTAYIWFFILNYSKISIVSSWKMNYNNSIVEFLPFFYDKIPNWNDLHAKKYFCCYFFIRCFVRVCLYFDHKRNVMKSIWEQQYFYFWTGDYGNTASRTGILLKNSCSFLLIVCECGAARIVLYVDGMMLYHAIIHNTSIRLCTHSYFVALCARENTHARTHQKQYYPPSIIWNYKFDGFNGGLKGNNNNTYADHKPNECQWKWVNHVPSRRTRNWSEGLTLKFVRLTRYVTRKIRLNDNVNWLKLSTFYVCSLLSRAKIIKINGFFRFAVKRICIDLNLIAHCIVFSF